MFEEFERKVFLAKLLQAFSRDIYTVLKKKVSKKEYTCTCKLILIANYENKSNPQRNWTPPPLKSQLNKINRSIHSSIMYTEDIHVFQTIEMNCLDLQVQSNHIGRLTFTTSPQFSFMFVASSKSVY